MKRRVLMLTLASVWQVAFAPLQRSSDSTFRISFVVLLSQNLLPLHTYAAVSSWHLDLILLEILDCIGYQQ
jgi:hypothetical protein